MYILEFSDNKRVFQNIIPISQSVDSSDREDNQSVYYNEF